MAVVAGLDDLRCTLDGEVFTPATPGYGDARRPALARYRDAHPRAVVQCATVEDVVRALAFARDTGTPVVTRGGGHCFAGRSSTTEGAVLDLRRLDSVTVGTDGRATIGSGARLRQVYDALHRRARTLPAGCGPTVGIAGLTLGGGLGLLGRRHGLTCDSLVSAQVVLADGRVIECDTDCEPDLYWALRGAGGGQFGVVTSFVFATIAEPRATRFELRWPPAEAAAVIAAWQSWAPDAPDDITANLVVTAAPGQPVRVAVAGAALRDAEATRGLLNGFAALSGSRPRIELREGMPLAELKRSVATPDPREHSPTAAGRSELFTACLPASAVTALLHELTSGPSRSGRHLTFTALGGAYDRVAAGATAYAHRTQRFVLDHLGDDTDAWVDRSWSIAHPYGSGRVYPNFPDSKLHDPGSAYHGRNLARLRTVKHHYDPTRLFSFPQAV